jgi:hypothetical protein
LKVEYQRIVGGGVGGEAWGPHDTRDEVAAIVGIRRLGSGRSSSLNFGRKNREQASMV